MKRFAATILAVLYLVTSAGATLQLHYCMDKLVDWNTGQHESATCGQCGMEKETGKDDGCCKYEHKFFKVNPDQKAAENSLLMMTLAIGLPEPFATSPAAYHAVAADRQTYPVQIPPRSSGIPVYILHNNFLI